MGGHNFMYQALLMNSGVLWSCSQVMSSKFHTQNSHLFLLQIIQDSPFLPLQQNQKRMRITFETLLLETKSCSQYFCRGKLVNVEE